MNERRRLLVLLPAAAALLAFAPVVGNGWVNWDDPFFFLANMSYRGLGLGNLRWMFASMHFGMYQPLSWLTYALDYSLWGMWAGGYHLTSLLLHAANAALFFAVARELLHRAGQDERNADLGAAFAALFFAAHPLRCESVAWASERRDVLSGFFYLLTVLLYLKRHSRRAESGIAWGAFAAFVAALLAKPMVISLPFVLLILDLHPLRRRALGEKLLFLVPALAAAAAGWAGQETLGEMSRYAPQTLDTRLAQASYSLVFYLAKTVFPLRLSPLYPRPEAASLLDPRYGLCLAAVLVLTALLWRARRSRPSLLAAWASYAVTLAPVSGLVAFGPQLVADRYSYLACLGQALLAGAGFARLARSRDRRVPALAGGLVLLAVLGLLSRAQARAWRDDESLWTRAVEAAPDNPVAQSFLGNVRAKQGRYDEAAEHFREALRLRPNYGAAHNNLANMLCRLGRPEEALPHYARAAELSPDHAGLQHNWGVALMRLGRREEAVERFRAELAAHPEDMESRAALELALPGGKAAR